MSKLEYLKKYMSKDDSGGRGKEGKAKKRKKRVKSSKGKSGGNLAILDDDVDWRSLMPERKGESSAEEDDPEDKPIVAEMRDETVVKWQPLGQQQSSTHPDKPEERGGTPDLSPVRQGRGRTARDLSPDLSPPRAGRRRRHDSPDTSPQLRVVASGRKGHPSAPKSKNHVTDADRHPAPSPPMKHRHDSPDISPPRRTKHDSPDISPPRRTRHDSPDLSPPRVRSRQASSPDLSPPHARTKHDSSDMSPPRRVRHDSPGGDLSPPRRQHTSQGTTNLPKSTSKKLSRQRHDSPDQSPPRKKRHESPDQSPPRRRREEPLHKSPPRRVRHDSPDQSPPRRLRHDSPDQSPPRRARHDSPDQSPPRRVRHDSPDQSPPRRLRHDSPDQSPPRRARHDSESPSRRPLSDKRLREGVNRVTDISPPRKRSRWDKKTSGAHTSQDRTESKGSSGTSAENSKPKPGSPERMRSGTKAGLQSAEVLRRENALARQRQEEVFKSMDPSVSGRGAETVYRDKEGRKVNPKLERLLQRQEEMKKLEEDEKFMEWGKGVATLQMAQQKVEDELYEMSKPLARYADDEDLERMLKEREREGDPMLKFLKKPKLAPSGKPKKERPTYKGSFAPNRFQIRPGYRWDGVDRSNGFEKAWFTRESNKKATSDMAYKWSVENM